MKVTALIAAAGLLLTVALPVCAQNASLRRDAGGVDQQQAALEGLSLAEKRAWLRDQMLREFSDVDRSAEITSRVAQMAPERVDALVKIYLQREANARQEATGQQRRSPGAAGSGGGPVGYAPVITWLPEGTSLGASAVVSPDRRYVRMSLQPFFSRIQRVDTFTFNSPARGYPNYYYPQQTVYPQYHNQPVYPQYYNRQAVNARPPQPRPIVYYDGLRTRTYYPPQR